MIFHSFAVLTCENIFQHKERTFVSPSNHVLFCFLYCINTSEIPNHLTLIVFSCEKPIYYYVAMANLIFSHVKITYYFDM